MQTQSRGLAGTHRQKTHTLSLKFTVKVSRAPEAGKNGVVKALALQKQKPQRRTGTDPSREGRKKVEMETDRVCTFTFNWCDTERERERESNRERESARAKEKP